MMMMLIMRLKKKRKKKEEKKGTIWPVVRRCTRQSDWLRLARTDCYEKKTTQNKKNENEKTKIRQDYEDRDLFLSFFFPPPVMRPT